MTTPDEKDALLKEASELLQRLLGEVMAHLDFHDDRRVLLGRRVLDWVEKYEKWPEDET